MGGDPNDRSGGVDDAEERPFVIVDVAKDIQRRALATFQFRVRGKPNRRAHRRAVRLKHLERRADELRSSRQPCTDSIERSRLGKRLLDERLSDSLSIRTEAGGIGIHDRCRVSKDVGQVKRVTGLPESPSDQTRLPVGHNISVGVVGRTHCYVHPCGPDLTQARRGNESR